MVDRSRTLFKSSQARMVKCSGTRPCTSCAKRGRRCLYETQYTGGRPPTPPGSTPNENAMGMAVVPTPVSVVGLNGPTDNQEPSVQGDTITRTQSRSSPELDSAEVHGQYVDTTSGLSFLHRARNRLSSHPRLSGADQQECNLLQPLIAAGDRPIVGLSLGLLGEPTLLSGSYLQLINIKTPSSCWTSISMSVLPHTSLCIDRVSNRGMRLWLQLRLQAGCCRTALVTPDWQLYSLSLP